MPPSSSPSLSEQLRALILARGLSPHRLAKASNVDARVIGRFINCQRGITIGTPDDPGPADRLAAALNLQLVERTRPPVKKTPSKPPAAPLPPPIPIAPDREDNGAHAYDSTL